MSDYEEMTIAEYRQQIVEELNSAGVKAYDWSDYRIEAPCAILIPATPFITKPQLETFETGIWQINFYLFLRVAKADNDVASASLDGLIAECLDIVGQLDEVEVSNIGTEKNDSNYMSATIVFSKTFKLTKGTI